MPPRKSSPPLTLESPFARPSVLTRYLSYPLCQIGILNTTRI